MAAREKLARCGDQSVGDFCRIDAVASVSNLLAYLGHFAGIYRRTPMTQQRTCGTGQANLLGAGPGALASAIATDPFGGDAFTDRGGGRQLARRVVDFHGFSWCGPGLVRASMCVM
jgi:hypothetical protein